MIKIAIIDSGISSDAFFWNRVIGGKSIYAKDDGIYMGDDYSDYNGHGTKCACVIQKYCENAFFFVLKVTQGETSFSSIYILIEALKMLIHMDVDIINISMSIIGKKENDELNKILKILREQQKIVVISVKNGNQESYPANNENCIGVREENLFEYKHRFIYKEKGKIQVVSKFYPVFVCDHNLCYEWFFGNSMATAYISAVLGNYIEKNGKENIYEKLWDNVNANVNYHKKKAWTEEQINLFHEMNGLFEEFISDYNYDKEMIVMNKRSNRIADTYEFLKQCGKRLGVFIPYNQIENYHFYSIHTIVQFMYSLKYPSVLDY
ncbi:MAG: S8 family serine peptidase [Lachnospiraceae bacterium]|nr:S8 family serine peptidase [Lachnospiraceae bacterium]